MRYLLRGENTIIMSPLDKDTTFLSTQLTVGDGYEYYIDTSIAPIPIRKLSGWQNGLRVNKDYHGISQSFFFHTKELTGSGSMSRTVAGYGYLYFGIFQMTLDTLGTEHPFNFVPLMAYSFSGTTSSMSTSILFYHMASGDSPYGPDGGGSMDTDIVTEVPFTAAANGLMTSIQFGWWRYATTGGITIASGTIEFKGLDLLVAS